MLLVAIKGESGAQHHTDIYRFIKPGAEVSLSPAPGSGNGGVAVEKKPCRGSFKDQPLPSFMNLQ